MHPLLTLAPWLLCTAPDDFAFRHASIALTEPPRRLDAADLDGDGDVDLLVLENGAGETARLEVLRNAPGGFTLGWSHVEVAYSSVEIWDLDLGDTDSDGDADVVYSVPYGSPRQRFNDGHGRFHVLDGLPTYSYQFEHELADVDGDGCLDVLYYEPDDFFDTYFGTLTGSCDGEFLDGDGRPDLAATNPSLDSVAVLFTSSTGTPGVPQRTAAGERPEGLVCVDLDLDGVLDLVVISRHGDWLHVLRGLGGGAFEAPQPVAVGDGPSDLVAADLDGDGDPDLAVACADSGRLSLLFNATR